MEVATGNTVLRGSLDMDGLPDIEETFIIVELKDSRLDFNDLGFVIREEVLSRLTPIGRVALEGQFLGYPQDFVAKGNVESNLGNIRSDIKLPHVPGHELAGTIAAVGRDVRRFKVGDRVTVPFVSGCGHCGECHSGNQQVCPNQFQPGFTHWGSFAEYVAIDYAETNLVHLPEEIDDATAASLGCRFATSFRAVADQARTGPGEWIAIHGWGGVGLGASRELAVT